MNQNKLIDPAIVAKERAERLRRLRNLANLSRKELCDGANININTYIGYEVVRYGGLTKKGAEKIVPFIATRGVYTTIEWLMFGLGPSPQVITDENINIGKMADKEQPSDFSHEMQKIAEEIYLFHKHYKYTIDYRIEDDGMSPKYDTGDFVAGIVHSGLSIAELVGLDCIVKTSENRLLVRHIYEGRIKDHFTLVCHNPTTTVIPVMYEIKLISAASIIWHRRVFTRR